MSRLRVAILDDEPPARQRLEYLLGREADFELAGSFEDPREAVEAIRRDPPDVLLLDVQMPEMDGFEVIAAVGPEQMPVTIFVTAFDQFAMRAFESAAVDYLLKPYDDERFSAALARARAQVRSRELGRIADRLHLLLGSLPMSGSSDRGAPARGGESRFLERIAVDVKGRILVMPAAEIDFILADGPYARLHVGDKVHLIRQTMDVLDEQLDPAAFCRIHRSAIVNLSRIRSLEPMFRGDYEVRLASGAKLRVSRTRRAELARRLGIPL